MDTEEFSATVILFTYFNLFLFELGLVYFKFSWMNYFSFRPIRRLINMPYFSMFATTSS